WADGVLGHSARKVGRTNAGGKSQPWNWFELVIQEEGCQAAGRVFAVGERRTGAVVEAAQFVVLLVETLQAHLQVVPRHIGTEGCLPAGIDRGAMVRGGARG